MKQFGTTLKIVLSFNQISLGTTPPNSHYILFSTSYNVQQMQIRENILNIRLLTF
jgi:hypothetical protein